MSKELWSTGSNSVRVNIAGFIHFVVLYIFCPIQYYASLARRFTYKCEDIMFRYHIPRTWVHTGDNLLVLHEELGGDPSKISLRTKTGQEICAHVSETDPPPASSWKPNSELISQNPEVQLTCERGWRITSINFASFGTPIGNCGTFASGACSADILSIVQQVRETSAYSYYNVEPVTRMFS